MQWHIAFAYSDPMHLPFLGSLFVWLIVSVLVADTYEQSGVHIDGVLNACRAVSALFV